jgi:hypothetical protein
MLVERMRTPLSVTRRLLGRAHLAVGSRRFGSFKLLEIAAAQRGLLADPINYFLVSAIHIWRRRWLRPV